MIGTILDYNVQSNEGAITGYDEKRYLFKKENWKGDIVPAAGQRVDFLADQEKGKAKEIYLHHEGNNNSGGGDGEIAGIVALALTFFLGFIGTMISQMALANRSFGKAAIPTFIHLVATILGFIPILGWIIYFGVTIYFMISNFKLTTAAQRVKNSGRNKYE